MLNYLEYLNLNGLSFKIGFDWEADIEWNNDCKIIWGIDYCGIIVLYNYWGTYVSFIGGL